MNIINKAKPVNYYAFVINLLVILLLIFFVLTHPSLPPKLPLWFSREWGEARLASPIYIWLLPTLSVSFFLTSYLVGKVLNSAHPHLAQVLVWTTTFISFVFLLSVYKIILIVS